MTYAYDQWAQMPVRDLYDTQMMAMAINAAKDMYEKGQQELKDFKKEYGDFSSPFVKDMQAYGKMMKGVRDIVDTAYANGIDLARSPEGRMIIQKAINSIDPAVYNEMKENAKWGTLYKQAEMELKAKDKFSQDAEDFYRRSQGLPSFEEFSTIGDKGEHNQWRSTSPIAFQTLAEATNGWYDKRTPYQLTAEQAKRELGSDYDPRKTYTGFLDEDLMNIAGQNTPGWQGSFWSEYYRDLAARQIAARGETPTVDAVEKQLQRNVADANQKWLVKPDGDMKNYLSLETLKLQRERLNLAKQKQQGDGNDNNNDNRLIGWTGRRVYNTNLASLANGANDIQKRYNSAIDKMSKGQKAESAHGLAWKLYRSMQDHLNGPDLVTGLALAANMSPSEVVDNDNNFKRLPVVFDAENNNLHLTNTRAMQYAQAGYNGKAKGNIPTGLEDYLKAHNVNGYIYSQDVTSNYSAYGPYDIYDLNFQVAVDKDAVKNYFGSPENLIKNGQVLGLKFVDKQGKILSSYKSSDGSELSNEVKNMNWDNITKVLIPSTRTVQASQVDNDQINHLYDEQNNTKSVAAKREAERVYDMDDDIDTLD